VKALIAPIGAESVRWQSVAHLRAKTMRAPGVLRNLTPSYREVEQIGNAVYGVGHVNNPNFINRGLTRVASAKQAPGAHLPPNSWFRNESDIHSIGTAARDVTVCRWIREMACQRSWRVCRSSHWRQRPMWRSPQRERETSTMTIR